MNCYKHLTNLLDYGDLLDYRFRGNYLNQRHCSDIDFNPSEGPYGLVVFIICLKTSAQKFNFWALVFYSIIETRLPIL